MMTVFVSSLVVLSLSLFAMMAIVPLMLETRIGKDLPENVIEFDHSRRHSFDIDQPAA